MKVWFMASEPIPYIHLEGLATCRAARKLQTCPSLCMALSMYCSCKFHTYRSSHQFGYWNEMYGCRRVPAYRFGFPALFKMNVIFTYVIDINIYRNIYIHIYT